MRTVFAIVGAALLSVFVLLTLAGLVMLALDHWKGRDR